MLFSAYVSLALASAVLAAPQDGQRAQCPTTITQTSSFPVPTTITSCKNTISKCTATTSIPPPPTTPCTKKTKTITTTTTIEKPKKTVTSTVTPSCPSPTTPATQLINVVGFQQNRCGNPAVAESGSRPNVQLVSLTIPQGGVIGATNPGDWSTLSTPDSGEDSCGRFDNGQISSLIFQSLPSNLAFASTCRLFAFRNVGCDEGAGSVAIDLSRAQRGLCQDPELLSNINSVQIRC
ncbi:hypothetical protein M409DRAFT_20218 [Zasmidium cellare ATCC 36951]|uniref:Uncharacterized protein n=1 Tax=Zasmidium cellare ATCC 36951 TaxID=1080233 RepID=A0A6A6CSX2_ZASCE|nr:uncharacterized protein M409DRAFT_20218 [Zasmidium cellare ATCC 36951]KAF2169803.1 hypothetical protein M409DRAFT_20218 [Zasmidium cellare ATCC 36951]